MVLDIKAGTKTLSSKRKEAFVWAECMNQSCNSIDEILEDLKDKIEEQDKEFIKDLMEELQKNVKYIEKHEPEDVEWNKGYKECLKDLKKEIIEKAGPELASPKGDKGVSDGK